LSLSLDVDVGVPNYFGGTSITGHGYVIYDGPQRRERAAVLIENYNNPLSLRHEPRRWTDRLLLKLNAEDLPQAENRVSLEEGEPVIHWRGHSDYAVRALLQAQEKLQEMLPIPVEKVASRGFAPTEAHIQGTHRMGTDPTRSVVDPALRCHEVRNLLALGAGAFPSCSPANPTLTL